MKLDQLHAATELNHLRVPPGNRLEALAGDRAGQHSIRINQQSATIATAPGGGRRNFPAGVGDE